MCTFASILLLQERQQRQPTNTPPPHKSKDGKLFEKKREREEIREFQFHTH